jgi:uncharacterized protein YecT (DUF1311 family)
MKQFFLLAAILCAAFFASAQGELPQAVTPEILKKIKAEVEKEALTFKKELQQQEMLSADAVEFSVDTFRIERTAAKRMETDYSTSGINSAVYDMADAYDKLMNKYYNKLLKLLKPEDKKILVAAQKSWLAFRDAELKMVSMMRKDIYSGGGTIQSNIAAAAYTALITTRTKEVFNYYDSVMK